LSENKKPNDVRIWDGWVRAFHWTFAAAVLFLLISGETSFLFYEWHQRIGELALLLVVFRLAWGFIGSTNARLLPLFGNPIHALHHITELALGRAHQTRGHNTAGGYAVLAMLLLVAFQAVSGLFIADEDELIEGSFYGQLDWELTETLLYLHHWNAKLLMALVGVHVFMILIYLLRAKQNLIRPMIVGKARWTNAESPPEITWTPAWVGFILLIVCIGIVGWTLDWFS